MSIIFLCSLICLSSGASIRNGDLAPLKKIANKSLIVSSSDLMQVIMDHKGDPVYLLSVLPYVDPAAIKSVIGLIKAILATSEANLAALTLSSTEANTAYTDAKSDYDASVVLKETLQDKMKLQLIDVADNLTTKTEALGAKKNAQNTLDTQKPPLDGEIKSLKHVIIILESLTAAPTASPTAAPIAPTAAPTASPTAASIAPTAAPTASPTAAHNGNKINGNFLSLSAESLSAANENDDVSEWKDTSGNGNDFSDSGNKCGTPKYGKASWNPSISVVRFGHSGKQTCLSSIISHPVSLSGTYVAVISWTGRSTSWEPIASQSWDQYWMLRFYVDTMDINMHVRAEHMPRVTVALGTPYIVVGRVDDANKMSYMWVWDINANDWLGKAEYSSAGIPTGGNELILIGRMDNTIYTDHPLVNKYYLQAEIAQFSMWDRFLSNSEVDNVVQQYIQND